MTIDSTDVIEAQLPVLHCDYRAVDIAGGAYISILCRREKYETAEVLGLAQSVPTSTTTDINVIQDVVETLEQVAIDSRYAVSRLFDRISRISWPGDSFARTVLGNSTLYDSAWLSSFGYYLALG